MWQELGEVFLNTSGGNLEHRKKQSTTPSRTEAKEGAVQHSDYFQESFHRQKRKLIKSGFQCFVALSTDLSLPNPSSDGSCVCFQTYKKAYELPRAKLGTYGWQERPVTHGMFRISPTDPHSSFP